jgi:hypothetical protein
VGQRSDFGNDWPTIVADWYLGQVPTLSQERGWELLGVLEELWPEYLDRVLELNSRGWGIMSQVVNDGLTLLTCRDVPGFDAILRRAKRGGRDERDALAELRLATRFRQKGCEVELEPEIEGKHPDCLVKRGEDKVYCEVTAPEAAQPISRLQSVLSRFSVDLMNENRGMKIEMYLDHDPGPDGLAAIRDLLRDSSTLGEDVSHEITGVGVVRYSLFARRVSINRDRIVLPPSLVHKRSGARPEINLAPFFPTPDAARRPGLRMHAWCTTSLVTICTPIIDERAASLMGAETQHFSRNEQNLLVIDVSAIPDGIRSWIPLIQRRLQPAINTRFGAVALITSDLSQGTGERLDRWTVLRNQYALRPLSDWFLQILQELDQSEPIAADLAGRPTVQAAPFTFPEEWRQALARGEEQVLTFVAGYAPNTI